MKYSGKIGFVNTYEKEVGVSIEGPPIERQYYGDILRNRKNLRTDGEINNNILIDNQFSIIGDSFAYSSIGKMKYLTYGGAKWMITSVEYQHPRLIISIGGMYHDQT